MKMTYFLVMLFVSVNLHAQQTCEIDNNKRLDSNIDDLQAMLCIPTMRYNYTLNPDCSYDLNAEVEIPNDNPDLNAFMRSVIINPRTNLESADRSEVLGLTMTPITNGNFSQVASVSKKGMSTKIYSNCQLISNASSATTSCAVDTGKTKIKGLFSIFVRNNTQITCTNRSREMKLCRFRTSGKAGSIPLAPGPCTLGAAGAAETFESIYRLAHYATHGNVRNLSKMRPSIDQFRARTRDNPNNGKRAVTFSGRIN